MSSLSTCPQQPRPSHQATEPPLALPVPVPAIKLHPTATLHRQDISRYQSLFLQFLGKLQSILIAPHTPPLSPGTLSQEGSLGRGSARAPSERFEAGM